MRRASVVLMAAVLGVGGMTGVSYGQGVRVVGPGVDDIQRASDPAGVMLAYRGLPDSDRAAGEEAYVRRMGELGLPEMVSAEAEEVLKTRPEDAAAWAVVAENKARRGEMMGALSAVASASNAAAGADVLVQRVAGSVLAWADAHPEALTAEARESADRVRERMKGKDTFEAAYAVGKGAYANQMAVATTTTQPSRQPSAGTGGDVGQQQYVYTTPVYSMPSYAPTYPSYPAYDYADYAPDYAAYPPYPYWDYGYAPFFGSSFVVVDRFPHFHDRFHGFHDGFHRSPFIRNGFHGGFHGRPFVNNGFHGGFRPGFGGGFHGGGFHGGGFHGGGFDGGMGGGFGGGMMHGGGFGGGGFHGGGGFGGGHR